MVRWPYLGLRWFLILMGAYLVIGLACVEIAQHRLGLGTGVVVMLIFATLKGCGIAVTRVTGPPPPD